MELDHTDEEIKKEITVEGGNENILLVDDEKAIIEFEKQMLEKMGYSVTSFSSSPDALAEFKNNPESYDLVISDMTMPELTGDQLAKGLISLRPDIPIIIFTGYSERMNQKSARSLGIKGILMKPVARKKAAKMIRNVLDNAEIEEKNFIAG